MNDPVLGIGSSVWVYDTNRRRYDEQRRLIYRDCWVECRIDGENRLNWLVNMRGECFRINKRDPRSSVFKRRTGQTSWVLSQAELDLVVWLNDHRYALAKWIEGDTARMIAAARATGYPTPPPEYQP